MTLNGQNARSTCTYTYTATAEKQRRMYALLTRCFSAVAELLVIRRVHRTNRHFENIQFSKCLFTYLLFTYTLIFQFRLHHHIEHLWQVH